MKVAGELRWEGGKEAERRAGGQGSGGGVTEQQSRMQGNELSAGPWYPGPSASCRAEMLISFSNG